MDSADAAAILRAVHGALTSLRKAPNSLILLDAGCGRGERGRRLGSHACRLVGIDSPREDLEAARATGTYDELVKSELVPYLRAQPEVFDAIVTATALIGLDDTHEVLSAAHDALRPAGLLLLPIDVRTPARLNLANGALTAAGFDRVTMEDAPAKTPPGQPLLLAIARRRNNRKSRAMSSVGSMGRSCHFPTIAATGSLSETTQTAADLFNVHGCLRIKSVFAPGQIRSLHSAFVEKYSTYFENKLFDDALSVGDRRTMVTVAVEGPFNSSRLYANRLIVTLMKRLLGQYLTLGSVGAIVSLPGAKNQQIHRDLPPLFSEQDNREGKFVASALPPYAVTVVIPLVPLDKETGTTRMWPGSHRDSPAGNRPGRFCDPYASLGDCLLMDYRLRHQGLANASDTVRTILYLVYCRPWFVDYGNYRRQEPLRMPRHEYERVPLEHRNLFSRTRGDDRVTPDAA